MNSSATLGSATSTAKAGTDASMCSQTIWDRRPARENREETRWPALSPGQPLRRERLSSFRPWKCATCTSAAGQLASRLWDVLARVDFKLSSEEKNEKSNLHDCCRRHCIWIVCRPPAFEIYSDMRVSTTEIDVGW